MTFAQEHLQETKQIIDRLDPQSSTGWRSCWRHATNGGRLFFLGVGGSAGNCSHAVNDFRKIEESNHTLRLTTCPELTARTNDEGWETVFVEWLKVSQSAGTGCSFCFLGRRRQP